MHRISSRNSFSLKHWILGNDSIIVLGHLRGKGIRTSTNDGESDNSSGNSNSNGSTSRDTSNQTKVEWTDEIFVTWSSTSILGIIDITLADGTVVSLVTWSANSSTSLNWVARSQEANILIRANLLGVLTSFDWVARFVGTNRVIVTEDVGGEETSLERITSIDSTDTAVVTNNGLSPVAPGNSRWLENTSVKSTFVSIITLSCSDAFWWDNRTSGGVWSTNLVSNGVVGSNTRSSSISGVLGNSEGSGLISKITVTDRPSSPLSFTRGWAGCVLSSGTGEGLLESISKRTGSSSITSGLGDGISLNSSSGSTVTWSCNKRTNTRNRADWDTRLVEEGVVSWISTVNTTKGSILVDNVGSVLLKGNTRAFSPFSEVRSAVDWTFTVINGSFGTVTWDGFLQSRSFRARDGTRSRGLLVNEVSTSTELNSTTTWSGDVTSNTVSGSSIANRGITSSVLLGSIIKRTWGSCRIGGSRSGDGVVSGNSGC